MFAMLAHTAHGDFLFGTPGGFFGDGAPVYRYRHDGTIARTYGAGLFGFDDPLFTEGIFGFTLSPDRQTLYVFGNDLGQITNFTFDINSGEYLGTLGINGSANIFHEWAEGFVTNYGLLGARTRVHDPLGNGDLFYIAGDGSVVNLVETSAGDVVGQIVSSQGPIYDMAFAPGAHGPQSRVYLATGDGIFAYEEMSAGTQPFQLVFSGPQIPVASQWIDIEIGPDGYLYVLNANQASPAGIGSDIERYDRFTGDFVDTFLSNDEFAANGKELYRIQFGPGGDLYATVFEFGELAEVRRYSTSTGQLRAVYDDFGFVPLPWEFLVLNDPIPEPASSLLALLGGVMLCCMLRRHTA